MSVGILPFEPQTAPRHRWATYHAFRRKRHEETYPEDPLRDDRAVEKLMKWPDPDWESVYFAAVTTDEPDEVIGWLEMGMTREGTLSHKANAHMAWAEIAVLAPYRRRGAGKALLAKAAEVGRERDRSLLVGGTAEEDGRRFIEALDAQVALRWRENRLELDTVDWDMVRQWAGEGPMQSPQTTLRLFQDHPEEELLEEFCNIINEVGNQEPRGDLDIGDELTTPEVFKERTDSYIDAGGTLLRAITLEPGRRISGYTVMGYFPSEGTLIHQFGTGVRQVHRGRGLGKWLKAALLLHVREAFPQVKVVVTGNATINAPMLSINDRLGFKPYKEGIEAQIRLQDVEAFLAKSSVGED